MYAIQNGIWRAPNAKRVQPAAAVKNLIRIFSQEFWYNKNCWKKTQTICTRWIKYSTISERCQCGKCVDKNRGEQKRSYNAPAYSPINRRSSLQHKLHIVQKVLQSINPKYSSDFHRSQKEYDEGTCVIIDKSKDKLSTLFARSKELYKSQKIYRLCVHIKTLKDLQTYRSAIDSTNDKAKEWSSEYNVPMFPHWKLIANYRDDSTC